MIGKVSAMAGPSVPVRIDSLDYHWHSRFQMDTTIVPGIGRRVNDEKGNEVYRLIYWHPGFYQARSSSDQQVNIEIRNGVYLFGTAGMPVTAMTERIKENEIRVPGGGIDAEPYFRTTFFEEVSEGYVLMVLSFPALRIY